MTEPFDLDLDRTAKAPLAEQIRHGIATAIAEGVLQPGARLPSWQDLAAQLGIARGTVRNAYEKLAAAQLTVASRAAGTRVARQPGVVAAAEPPPDEGSFIRSYQEMTAGPALFQVGVPATETFPAPQRARRRSIPIRAASMTCGARSPGISPLRAASTARCRKSSSPADSAPGWA